MGEVTPTVPPFRQERGIVFVESSLASCKYRDSSIQNPAVNLGLCKAIRKSRIHWYPDNHGIPSIKFEGCDIEWAYKTDADRDADYARIIAVATP